MTNDQMREAFEAYCKRDGLPPDLMEDEYEVWQAAYAAGMERAKVIAIACDMGGLSVGDVIDAIRAEIKGADHEG